MKSARLGQQTVAIHLLSEKELAATANDFEPDNGGFVWIDDGAPSLATTVH